MAGSSSLATRRKLRKKSQKATKSAKLGSGKRFAAVSKSIESSIKPSQLRPGQTKKQAAKGIAAAIGRKKYGKKKFQSLASKGK